MLTGRISGKYENHFEFRGVGPFHVPSKSNEDMDDATRYFEGFVARRDLYLFRFAQCIV